MPSTEAPANDYRPDDRTHSAGPGSVVDGREYVIEVDAPIARLPSWLAALLGRK
jgi:hypothetical protein